MANGDSPGLSNLSPIHTAGPATVRGFLCAVGGRREKPEPPTLASVRASVGWTVRALTRAAGSLRAVTLPPRPTDAQRRVLHSPVYSLLGYRLYSLTAPENL